MAKSTNTAVAAARKSRSKSGKTGRSGKTIEFPNYTAATKYLYDHVDLERVRPKRVDPDVFKLDRMRALLDALGSPDETVRCVHIAGTNGKGSVCAMLAACLRNCNCAVGTFTSPHLVDLRERIQINGEMIQHAQFAELLGRVATAMEGLDEDFGDPTFFELMTAVGILHFAEQAVDVAIIETGLGGRLDSTNVITPAVSAITGIGLDHTQFLGETVEQVAAEKAGIFKSGVPALTIDQEEGVLEVLRQKAEEANAPLEVVGKDIEFSFRFEASPQLGPHSRVGLSTERSVFEHVPVPLPGEHQARNCGLVLAIIDKLVELGYALPNSAVIQGLEKTDIPGRMEILNLQPRVLLDGAHNPMSIKALIRSIGAHVPYDSMVMIVGCAADKDVDEILRQIALGGDKIIFTRAKANPRAMEPRELGLRFAEISPKMYQVADDLKEAVSIASRAAGRDDLICITGSFYLVGEAKKLLSDKGGRGRG